MNFFRYTLTARFVTYLVVTLIQTLLMIALLSAMNFTTGVIVVFTAFITFWVAAIIARYFNWRTYCKWQKTDQKIAEAREALRKYMSYSHRKN